MSAQLAIHGRLARDLRPHETKSGVSMTMATIAASVDGRVSHEGEERPLWPQLVGIGRQADDLTRHRQSNLLSRSGRLQLSRYSASASEARDDWQVIVDLVVSNCTVRPDGSRCSGSDRGRRPLPTARDDGHQASVHDAPLDDLIGF